jgi:hypothetical protein
LSDRSITFAAIILAHMFSFSKVGAQQALAELHLFQVEQMLYRR